MRPNWKINYVRYRGLFLNLVSKYRKRDDIKVYLELLLSLATVSLFAVFALRPTLITISTLIKDIESKRETIAQMDDKIDDIIAAQRVYDRERSRIDQLKIAIPQTADPDVILRQIEGSVADSAVSVNNFNMGEMNVVIPADDNSGENPASVEEVNISMEISADYTELLELISLIEELRKPIDIKSTALRLEGEEEQTSVVLTIQAGIPILSN